MELAKSILGQVRDETLPAFKVTLQRYLEVASQTETAVGELKTLAAEAGATNKKFASMLNDEPGGLLALPGSLEDAATRVADVSEQLHGDVDR